MTSTVLDVTVLLLCVSASVVALGAAGGGPEVAGAMDDDVADRLVTETATVTYGVGSADGDADAGGDRSDHDARTVHATLAELLIMATVDGTKRGTGVVDRFRSKALETVDDALDPRTRVDVSIGRTTGSASADSGSSQSALDAGRRPVPGVGNGGRSTTDGITEGSGGSRSRSGRRTGSLGNEPPRNADITTTVVAHPGPRGSLESDVRIVVRTW